MFVFVFGPRFRFPVSRFSFLVSVSGFGFRFRFPSSFHNLSSVSVSQFRFILSFPFFVSRSSFHVCNFSFSLLSLRFPFPGPHHCGPMAIDRPETTGGAPPACRGPDSSGRTFLFRAGWAQPRGRKLWRRCCAKAGDPISASCICRKRNSIDDRPADRTS